MEFKNNHIKEYFNSYENLKQAARKGLKEYGKVLDINKLLGDAYLNKHFPDTKDMTEDELYDLRYNYIEYCVVEDKFDTLYPVGIYKAEWDEKELQIKVFIQSDDGYCSEWVHESFIGWGRESVYTSVLQALDNVLN